MFLLFTIYVAINAPTHCFSIVYEKRRWKINKRKKLKKIVKAAAAARAIEAAVAVVKAH